ncbi:50S ribosomal protein L16 [Candidatus Falkowbacteria bacterium]|jgi:large subunit ribosomal protein L16|nr:50S ribosomal protein L16 [Candidatus Falkowbacteria bacterium]MBT4433001.1 50S ribosomal protein L16 [Candidatus Falkowbacteria bacterium]
MLAPKKTKYRKAFKGRRRGRDLATAGTEVSFGEYGLKAQSASWITSRQIESARRTMTNFLKRKGKMWIRIFPDKPVTAKSAEVPMGSGKGAVDHYVAIVKSGMILFEMSGIEESEARKAMKLAEYKLPVKCKFIVK